MPVRLDCPLCGTTVAEGRDLVPGTCPGCGAAYAGGGDDPPSGMAMALAHWGIEGLDAVRVADGLFRLPPDHDLNHRVAPMSDRRDGFYRWWIFLAAGAPAREVLAAAARHSRTA